MVKSFIPNVFQKLARSACQLLNHVRYIFGVLILLISSSPNANASNLALNVHAEAAILMNADSGAILYAKNMHAHYFPASITKIATASYALKKMGHDLDVMITADQECIGTVSEEAMRRSNYSMPAYLLIPDASHIGIKKGETLSLRDLLYGLMVASGDDAANVIAKHVSGTIPQFVSELNAYVRELGCQNTVFYNPHGLHHPKQHTTAYDMAILTKEAMKNPTFREIVSTVRYTRPKTNKQESSILIQTNRLLRPGKYHYSKAIGVKTGYLSSSITLVSAANDGDRTLIAVLLKAQDGKQRFLDARMMFESAFAQPKVRHTLLRQGPQKFTTMLAGARDPLTTYITSDVLVDYYPAEDPKARCLLFWEKDLAVPVAKDQRVGELIVQSDKGHVLSKTPLYAQQAVDATWTSWLQGIFNVNTAHGTLVKVLGVMVLAAFLAFFAYQLK